jgi:hypothetical protein
MKNTFEKLFSEVISLWPDSVVILDKILHKNGGASIPMLTAIHDEIQEKITSDNDDPLLLHMDFAVYTVLHQAARARTEICPKNIDIEMVRKIFTRNVELERIEGKNEAKRGQALI